MILASPSDFVPASRPESVRWQQALKEAIRDPARLCRMLELPNEMARHAAGAAEQFALFAPRGYVARMRKGDPHDPLLRQVLPLDDELRPQMGFTSDPLEEESAARSPGLLQKYRGRALLVTTGVCAVHCRYCFRRHFPYSKAPKSLDDWEPALQQIAADETLEEVILSGGDPLVSSDSWLAQLAQRLSAISHVQRLRVHTRLPIVLPQRVDGALLSWLVGTRLTPVVVVHANHPAEIDEAVTASLQRLAEAGATVLNQSVLLRGVNDNVEALAELSRRLFAARTLPYYLHQLDRVAGAAHFEVPVSRGWQLVEQLRDQLPGYLVPRYVQELPGESAKLPVPSSVD